MSQLPGHLSFVERLKGVQKMLIAAHGAGTGMSSASKGTEREYHVRDYLREVLPNSCRVSGGDIIDSHGGHSGQLDCFLEWPFAPTLPVLGGGVVRLAPAEAVVAVVEVKSDVAGQWAEVQSTVAKVAPIRRSAMGAAFTMGPKISEQIPVFAVGYAGWKTTESIKNRIGQTPGVHGVLVVNEGLYVSASGIQLLGPLALWGLIVDLQRHASGLMSASPDLMAYAARSLGMPWPPKKS